MPPGGTRDRAARHARHARRVAWSARSSAHFRRTRSTQTRHHGRTRAACQAHRAGIVTEVAAAGIEGSQRSAISGPRGAAQDCRSCPRLYPTHLRSCNGRQRRDRNTGRGHAHPERATAPPLALNPQASNRARPSAPSSVSPQAPSAGPPQPLSCAHARHVILGRASRA